MNTDIRMKQLKINRADLVHADLSFTIIKAVFNVHNALGYGFAEKTYQKAVSEELKILGLNFEEQVFAPVYYKGKEVSRGYLDFLVENLVVLELKKGDRFSKAHIDQVYQYLLSKKLQLGILAYFTAKKVVIKRVVNINP